MTNQHNDDSKNKPDQQNQQKSGQQTGQQQGQQAQQGKSGEANRGADTDRDQDKKNPDNNNQNNNKREGAVGDEARLQAGPFFANRPASTGWLSEKQRMGYKLENRLIAGNKPMGDDHAYFSTCDFSPFSAHRSRFGAECRSAGASRGWSHPVFRRQDSHCESQ
jgi:hypothetical protein